MIALIVLIPLLVSIVAVALNKNYKMTKYIALFGCLISLLLLPLISFGVESFDWFAVGGRAFTLTILITPLSVVLLFIVLFMGLIISFYSFSFMELPSEQKKYHIEMLALETTMLAFAMAGNFILLFIAWEFLSVVSYLLIGFWNGRDRANRAARKSITIILIGDLAMLAAIVMFLNTFGTLEFSGIIAGIQSARAPLSAIALLMIAILTKSSQFPFHEWLPDTAESPTPGSAFLQSTGTVKAGVFAMIILFPLFAMTNVLQFIFYVGLITVIVSMFNAMREQNVKRVLAYSTTQELGLMFVAIGSNALLAAIYFFFAQSFYKTLLLLSSGVSTKATGKEDLKEVGGLRQDRIVYLTTLFGVLALAGFVPFAGFFAYLGIYSEFRTNLLVYEIISLVWIVTGFYIFRWFTLQTKRAVRKDVVLNYKAQPESISYSLIILALATLFASLGFFIIPAFVGNELGFVPGGLGLSLNVYSIVGETVAVGVGSASGYLLYKQKKKKKAEVQETENFADVFYTSNMMNSVYSSFAAFVQSLGDGISYFDESVNGLFDGLGRVATKSGNALGRMAAGEINASVTIFVVGLLLLLLLLAMI